MQAQWIASASLVVLGVALFAMGRWPKRVGDIRRCRRCEYDLSATSGDTCPDCGRALSARGTVIGTRNRRPGQMLAGAIILVGGLGWGGRAVLDSAPLLRYRFVTDERLLSTLASLDRNASFRSADELLRRFETAERMPPALGRYLAGRFDDYTRALPITTGERYFLRRVQSAIDSWGSEEQKTAAYRRMYWPWLQCPSIGRAGEALAFQCPGGLAGYQIERISVDGEAPPSGAAGRRPAMLGYIRVRGDSILLKPGRQTLRVDLKADEQWLERNKQAVPPEARTVYLTTEVAGLDAAAYDEAVQRQLSELFRIHAWWRTQAEEPVYAALIIVSEPCPVAGRLELSMWRDEKWAVLAEMNVNAGYFGMLDSAAIHPNFVERESPRRMRLRFTPTDLLTKDGAAWPTVEYEPTQVPHSTNYAGYVG